MYESPPKSKRNFDTFTFFYYLHGDENPLLFWVYLYDNVLERLPILSVHYLPVSVQYKLYPSAIKNNSPV